MSTQIDDVGGGVGRGVDTKPRFHPLKSFFIVLSESYKKTRIQLA